MTDLLQEYYREVVGDKKGKELIDIADFLGISYYTLKGKTSGRGSFTEKQLSLLKEYFNAEKGNEKNDQESRQEG